MNYINKIIKYLSILSLIVILSNHNIYAQENARIMAYNILEYPNTDTGGDTTSRNENYRNIMSTIDPDIVAISEIESETDADSFLTKVMNSFSSSSTFKMGTFVLNSTGTTDNNVIYYKPSKFTFLSASMVVNSGNHPTLEYQLYNNLTGDKIIIYGVHFTSGFGAAKESQRETEANAIRSLTDQYSSSEYFIAAGDFNLVEGGAEAAYDSLLDQTNSGYFIDPAGLAKVDWKNISFAPYHTFSTRKDSIFAEGSIGGLDLRLDLIINSQSIVTTGGIDFVSGSFTIYGNDGQHFDSSIIASPTIPEGSSMAEALYGASDHLPIYADYTFDFPTTVNPPYPGSIVFTQVGADDDDVIEFMTLYRMDLTTLRITDNSITDSTGGPLSTDEGTFDLSNLNGTGDWNDVPAGTFVRLSESFTSNDNDADDRILKYKGSTEPTKPSLTTGGEQLIAYTVSGSDTTYIAGINWGNVGGWLTNPTSSTSYAPGTPSDIHLGSLDNYYYSGSVDDILYVTRDSLTISGNWNGSDTRIGYLSLGIGNSALPVELAFFTGTLNGSNVELRWRTETEVNNYGFDIERTKDNTDWLTIGFVEGHGNSNSPKQYNFIDTDINQSGTYYYRLKQIDNDGAIEYSGIVAVEVGVPNSFYLSQNYPNPFNPGTRIDYTLPERQLVSLRIYNMLGELVRELVNEVKEAGSYSVTFDASFADGGLPSGVYIYRLQTQNSAINKKMTLIK